MTGPERDDEVDDWLQSRRSLLRSDEHLLTLEPPPELDRLVIERARRELRSGASRPGFFRGSRFTVPFAIAATVVLSFTLVLEINRYESGQASLQARAQRSEALGLTVSASAPSAEPAPMEKDAKAEFAEPAAPRPAMQSAPARAMAQNAPPVLSAQVRSSQDRSNPLRSNQQRSDDAGRASGGDAQAELKDAAASTRDSARERSSSLVAAEVSRPADAVATGAVATGAIAGDAVASAAATMPAAAGASSAAPARAMALPSASNAMAAPARPALEWWQAVQRLQRAGRFSEAAQELAALRKAHPDFVEPAAAPPASTVQPASAEPPATQPPR